jgi:hypothetical protein
MHCIDTATLPPNSSTFDNIFALVRIRQNKYIQNVLSLKYRAQKKNTVFRELNEISNNTLKSLYLLAFTKYEGFNDFNIQE